MEPRSLLGTQATELVRLRFRGRPYVKEIMGGDIEEDTEYLPLISNCACRRCTCTHTNTIHTHIQTHTPIHTDSFFGLLSRFHVYKDILGPILSKRLF